MNLTNENNLLDNNKIVRIRKLQQIIKDQQNMEISFKETSEIAESLMVFFNILGNNSQYEEFSKRSI